MEIYVVVADAIDDNGKEKIKAPVAVFDDEDLAKGYATEMDVVFEGVGIMTHILNRRNGLIEAEQIMKEKEKNNG